MFWLFKETVFAGCKCFHPDVLTQVLGFFCFLNNNNRLSNLSALYLLFKVEENLYLTKHLGLFCRPCLELLQHVFTCRLFLLPVHNHAVLCRLKLMALTHVGCVFPATVTRLVPSRLTAMRQASVAASLVSPDPNVTAVLEDFSTSRRAAAHVSI